jgi:hypothetical protein
MLIVNQRLSEYVDTEENRSKKKPCKASNRNPSPTSYVWKTTISKKEVSFKNK